MDLKSIYRDRIMQKYGTLPLHEIKVGHSKRSSDLQLPDKLNTDLNFCLSPIASAGGEEPVGFGQFLELPNPGLTEESPQLQPDSSMPKQVEQTSVSMTQELSTCVSSMMTTPSNAGTSKIIASSPYQTVSVPNARKSKLSQKLSAICNFDRLDKEKKQPFKMANELKSKHRQPQIFRTQAPSKVQIPSQKVPATPSQQLNDDGFCGHSLHSLLCIEEESMLPECDNLDRKYQTEAPKPKISRVQTQAFLQPVDEEPVRTLIKQHGTTRSCAQLPSVHQLQISAFGAKPKASALKEFMSNKRSRSIVKLLDTLPCDSDGTRINAEGKRKHQRTQTWMHDAGMRPFFTKNKIMQ